MKTALAALTIAAAILVPSLAAGEAEPTTAPPPTTSAAVCDHHCQFKRDREALREKTDRNPIPTYIVSCESGGDYRAQNPNSDAGGKYQVMPSTWSSELPSRRVIRLAEDLETRRDVRKQRREWGTLDKGPRWSSPLLQDIVAANIYEDSGTAPWTCA